jgi:hypothetical protein
MSNGFTKLFGDIVTSSIWSEDDKTRLVWITLLALSDATGHVNAALPGLARAANVSLEDCAKAVARLEAPDQYSRSPENEGRRIAKAEGGWLVLNYVKHRNRGRVIDRREYMRNLMRKRRHSVSAQANDDITGDNRSASASGLKVDNTDELTQGQAIGMDPASLPNHPAFAVHKTPRPASHEATA